MSLKLRNCNGELSATKMVSFLFSGGKTESLSEDIALLGLAVPANPDLSRPPLDY